MPLATCHISGIFLLSAGIRQTESKYYVEYLSTLALPSYPKLITVSVRKFAPPCEALLPDGSHVFMVAKVALPPGEDGMLDSIFCTPFNPPSESSEDPIAKFSPTHTVFVTGTVCNVNGNGPTRSFTLTTGDYVYNKRRTFDIRFVPFSKSSCDPSLTHMCLSFKYDGTSSRWRNVHLPIVGSFVTATGIFAGVLEDDRPVFDLLDIAMNP